MQPGPAHCEVEVVVVRFIGMDVHRDFCEVALVQDGRLRSIGQVRTVPAELEVFARRAWPGTTWWRSTPQGTRCRSLG
jgi:hypothetical protein